MSRTFTSARHAVITAFGCMVIRPLRHRPRGRHGGRDLHGSTRQHRRNGRRGQPLGATRRAPTSSCCSAATRPTARTPATISSAWARATIACRRRSAGRRATTASTAAAAMTSSTASAATTSCSAATATTTHRRRRQRQRVRAGRQRHGHRRHGLRSGPGQRRPQRHVLRRDRLHGLRDDLRRRLSHTRSVRAPAPCAGPRSPRRAARAARMRPPHRRLSEPLRSRARSWCARCPWWVPSVWSRSMRSLLPRPARDRRAACRAARRVW